MARGQWGAEGPPKKFVRCQNNGAGRVREGQQGAPGRTTPGWLGRHTGSLLCWKGVPGRAVTADPVCLSFRWEPAGCLERGRSSPQPGTG